LKTVVLAGEWYGELHKVTKSGNEIIVESRWTLVRDDEQQNQLSTQTSQRKKQFEAQFLRAQRLESIGTLASGIAHDLTMCWLNYDVRSTFANENLPERSQRLLKTVESSQTWSSISQASSIVCARSRRKAHDSSSQALNFGNSAHCQRDISQID